MNPESSIVKESLTVYRRLSEPLPPPALAFPIWLFFVALIFVLAIRHRDELKLLTSGIHWFLKLAIMAILSLVLGILPGIVLLALSGALASDVWFGWTLVWVFSLFLKIVVVGAVSLALGLMPAVVLWLMVGLFIVTFRKRNKLEGVALCLLVLVILIGNFGMWLIQETKLEALLVKLGELPNAWVAVMLPVMVIAAIYVGAMYFFDARTVHVLWACLLGLLRMGVYFLLGWCFLLPATQVYNTTVTESKVLVLFDVSGSMDAVDGQEGQGSTTRQEKIVEFLTKTYRHGTGREKTFLEHLTDETPVACYRFGNIADDDALLFDAKTKKAWQNKEDWQKWFRPDKLTRDEIVESIPANITTEQQRTAYVQSKLALYEQLRTGTDVGGSALQILQHEGNSRIQAIVVFSDGNSNRGDEEAIRQLLERAGNVKRPIHIITVGVGDYKQPVRIRINPLVGPQIVRADDGDFEVSVPVFGDGLHGETFEVRLEAQRVKDRNGIELKQEPVYPVETKKGKFSGGGEFPYDEVVFKVNLSKLTGIKADQDSKGLLQGQWNFVAKVPRHPNESADKINPMHISFAKTVTVNDNTMRVLLFASGPSQEYQFVRTWMSREADAKRAKLSIYLQTAKNLEDVSQDVDGSHLLNDFPNKLVRTKEGKKGDKGDASKEGDPMNLKSYDVIIAFDPDWTQLTKLQKELLKEWVDGDSRGGIIFVAGQAHTLRLIPPVDAKKFEDWDLKPIFDIFPVELARPSAVLQADQAHDATIPYKLDFTGLAKGYDFIKLDDDNPAPLGGWKEFFGKTVISDFPGGGKVHPERGFFNYLRVNKAKETAEVIATFSDPKAPLTIDRKAQPYFVSLRVGDKGKSFYIGSGEMWRLRTFKTDYHQRFWVKLARYVSSGTGGKSFGRISMAAEYVTGIIPIEAEIRDKDGSPLNSTAAPVVTVRRIDGRGLKDEKLPTATLKAKKDKNKDGTLSAKSVRGIFVGNLLLEKEGAYEARIDIPGTEEAITQTFDVKPPNVEMANLRTNFPKLYNMATDATPAILAKLDEEVRKRLTAGADRPAAGTDTKVEIRPGARLFFRLAGAPAVSQCILKVRPEEDKVKGAVRDFWQDGPDVYLADSWEGVRFFKSENEAAWVLLQWFALPALLLLLATVVVLGVTGRWIPLLWLGGSLVLVGVSVLIIWLFDVPDMVYAMFAVPAVALLAASVMMLVARRWIAAVGLALALVAIEVGMFLLIEFTIPSEIFQPSAYSVLLVVPALVCLTAAGILLVAERYFWVVAIVASLAVYLLAIFMVNLLAEPSWEHLQVDFAYVLILVALLLSAEWFTRKMLRLA